MEPDNPISPASENGFPRRRVRAENLEFNFEKAAHPSETASAPRATDLPEEAAAQTDPPDPSPTLKESAPLPSVPVRMIITDDEEEPPKEATSSPKREPRLHRSEPRTDSKPEPKPEPRAPRAEDRPKDNSKERTKDPNMSTSSFSQYQQNVQRQAREQRIFGSFLNIVAIALVGAILLVAVLAAYGGYILSHQIKQQSATITQMESRFRADIAALNDSLKQTRDTVDTLEGVSQAQKQQITWLNAQLTDVRGQTKKEREILQSRLQRIESRLFEAERRSGGSWSR
jgi:Tfp pilus assembly protein PilE